MRILLAILKWTGIVLAALASSGLAYQAIGLVLDTHYAPPGSDLVSVGGRRVHLTCMGQGRQTIVLDAGAGAGLFEWYRVQPALAQSARTCAFDRAGLGWSQADGPHYDALAAADQLHALVLAAKIATPFVYVGHSLGANFGLVYAARFPRDVSALVLLEPGLPRDLREDFHGTRNEAMTATDCDLTCHAAGAATLFGVVRLSTLFLGHKTFDADHRARYQAFLTQPDNMETTVASLNATVKTAYEFDDAVHAGGKKLLVFASADPLASGEFGSVADYSKWRAGQRASFAWLARQSTLGFGPVIVPKSNHATMVLGKEQAAFVAAEITRFLSRVE
jgi:pimeloyl-ACP methyl ester carboxylesterase